MGEGRCGPCWTILAYTCTHGHDQRLCAAFVDYDQTGNPAALDTALRVADPALLQAARAQAVALGLATPPKEG